MNYPKYIFAMALWLLANPVFSQEQKQDCQDVVHLKGGSVLRGKILEYNADGNLVMDSWSGANMQIPAINVKRIEQKCKDDKKARLSLSQRPYSFPETGWYHASRFIGLPGESGSGVGLQHSSGIKINRLFGVGLGAGIEKFEQNMIDVPSYPIFAELRGYFLKKNITPFYALGAGYGFARKKGGRDDAIFDGSINTWRGGWMLQGQLGYRIGNHAIVNIGIRLQHKTRRWEYPWTQVSGIDQILHKRIDIGIGLLL